MVTRHHGTMVPSRHNAMIPRYHQNQMIHSENKQGSAAIADNEFLDDPDWHKQFQAISHSYIETKMKNTIWRIIAGKLYLGDIAQKYLIFRKKPQVALKYEYCPYCSNTFTKS